MNTDKKIKYDYVIFHKNCFDGFTSFMILQKTNNIHENAIVLADVPSAKTPPSNIENKNIVIMDVAYKYDILKQICLVAKSVLFIDHHITIRNDVTKIKDELGERLTIIYDEHECGSSLTWKYFFGTKDMPLFVKYVKDNDIGEWKLSHTLEFIASLEIDFETNLKKETIKKWNKLFSTQYVNKIIKHGNIYRRCINHLANENARRYSLEAFPSEKVYNELHEHFEKPAQFKVAVICGSCPSATRLGTRVLELVECDFVIMWNLNLDKKEYIISFRSKHTDVGTVAKAFGGGGHTLASACSFPTSRFNIEDLFFEQSLPRQYLQ